MALTIEPGRNREITVELEGQPATFILAPASYEQMIAGFGWAAQQGLWDPENPSILGNVAGLNKRLMNRIIGWKGFVMPDGKPLPCTDDNKLLVFGKFPGALMDLSAKLQEQMEGDRKNSETLPGGTSAS